MNPRIYKNLQQALIGQQHLTQTGVTIILIEHVMRFLVALADRVMILHHGEQIYDGSAAGLVEDKTVVDVYLGEGASARLAALLRGGEK